MYGAHNLICSLHYNPKVKRKGKKPLQSEHVKLHARCSSLLGENSIESLSGHVAFGDSIHNFEVMNNLTWNVVRSGWWN